MPRKSRQLTKAELTLLLGAIDGLALALTKWTVCQRRVYERAVRLLKRAGAGDAA